MTSVVSHLWRVGGPESWALRGLQRLPLIGIVAKKDRTAEGVSSVRREDQEEAATLFDHHVPSEDRKKKQNKVCRGNDMIDETLCLYIDESTM